MAKNQKQATAKQAVWLSVAASFISTLFWSALFFSDQPQGESLNQQQATRFIAVVILLFVMAVAVTATSWMIILLWVDGNVNTTATYLFASLLGVVALLASVMTVKGLKDIQR